MHPDWTAERLHVEASKFVSPPGVAPHCTGGPVDLTLSAAAGEELDVGTGPTPPTPPATRVGPVVPPRPDEGG